MKLRYLSILAVMVAVVIIGNVSTAQAKGLLGERYIGLGIEATKFGDDIFDKNSELDDTMTEGQLFFNTPISSNLDFKFGVSYGKYDTDVKIGSTTASGDVKQLSIDAGLTYRFQPDAKIDPFLLGVISYVRTETKASVAGTIITNFGWYSIRSTYNVSVDTKEDDFGFTLGGGLEVDLSEKMAITPAIKYKKVDDLDNTELSVVLNIWLTDSVSWQLGGGYGFDEGDVMYGTSLVLSF